MSFNDNLPKLKPFKEAFPSLAWVQLRLSVFWMIRP